MSPLHETRVRENVWVWTLGGGSIASSYGANCGAVIGETGVLLLDPFIAPAHARLAESALSEKTSLPIRGIVLTHHHTDHALGAGRFARAGVEILAHAACRRAMSAEHPGLISSRRAQPEIAALFQDAQAYEPTRVFDLEASLDLGGTVARVLHPGHNHTPGDAVVHLPRESVVFCGDLVSRGYHVNYEDAAVENLAAGLDRLRSLEARTYVPGHGSAGAAEILDEQARYHAAVRDAVLSGDDPAETIRRAFPGYRLEAVLPSSLGKSWDAY